MSEVQELIKLLTKVDRFEQEIKSLYEEKNCLHKIIDRLLENSGYSKDIASAEDFEDVYEDMQIKRNKLIELEQENAELKEALEEIRRTMQDIIKDNGRHNLSEYSSPIRIEKIINEVLGND